MLLPTDDNESVSVFNFIHSYNHTYNLQPIRVALLVRLSMPFLINNPYVIIFIFYESIKERERKEEKEEENGKWDGT